MLIIFFKLSFMRWLSEVWYLSECNVKSQRLLLRIKVALNWTSKEKRLQRASECNLQSILVPKPAPESEGSHYSHYQLPDVGSVSVCQRFGKI